MKVVYPSYFPFEFPQASDLGVPIGANTPYPVGLSLKDAMTLFWQAKTINCSTSLGGCAGAWGLDSTYGTVITAEDQFVVFDPSTDSLVWSNSPGTGMAMAYLIPFSPLQTGYTYAQACVQSGGLYYPNLLFFKYVGWSSLAPLGVNLGEGSASNATLIINGNSYLIPVIGSTTSIPACDVVLTVDSLWPYTP